MEVSGRGASFRPYTEKEQSKHCEQCEEDELTVEATGFCSVCKDYLCDSCIRHHKKFRATKNHVVLLDINIPLQKPGIKEDESYEVSGQGGSIESGNAYEHGSDDSDVVTHCNQTDKDGRHQSKIIAKVKHDVLKDTKDVEQKIKEIKITQTQQQRTKPDVHLKRASHHTKDDIAKKKDDDLVIETFYHRSGKEFQCIYQSGMRFFLDDLGSKKSRTKEDESYEVSGQGDSNESGHAFGHGCGDVSKLNNCQQCVKNGLTIGASGFCPACNEYLCNGCAQQHRQLRATVDHIVFTDSKSQLRKPQNEGFEHCVEKIKVIQIAKNQQQMMQKQSSLKQHYNQLENIHSDIKSVSAEQEYGELISETFYHISGKEFQCLYQSGMRSYLDEWRSNEWQPFPKRWYNEGLLVTNNPLQKKADSIEVKRTASSNSRSGGVENYRN